MIRRAASHHIATWALIALALFLVPPLAACGRSRKQGTVNGTPVRSDDGRATLVIPDGALPAGIKASDVRVRLVTVDAPGVVAAYRLEPDGLRLAHPVTLRLHLDQAPDRALSALHLSSDGTTEPLAYQASAADATTGGFTYTTTVSHFSDVVLSESDAVRMTVDPAADVHVGESFIVRAHVGWSEVDLSWPKTTPSESWGGLHWHGSIFERDGVTVVIHPSSTKVIVPIGPGSAERGATVDISEPPDPSSTYVTAHVAVGPNNPVNPALTSVKFMCNAAGPWAMSLEANVTFVGPEITAKGTQQLMAPLYAMKVIAGECLPAPKSVTPGGATSQGGVTTGGGAAGGAAGGQAGASGSGTAAAGGGGTATAGATAAPTEGGSGGTTSGTTGSGGATGASAPVAGTETSQNCPTLPNGVRHGEYEYGPYRCDGNVIIRVMIWNGHEFPIYQFRKAPPDICAYDHYHAIGGIGYALDGTTMKEMGYPQEGCGFGVAGASAPSTLTQARWDAWVKAHPLP